MHIARLPAWVARSPWRRFRVDFRQGCVQGFASPEVWRRPRVDKLACTVLLPCSANGVPFCQDGGLGVWIFRKALAVGVSTTLVLLHVD